MKRYGLVVFDCDGVVADSEVLACGCLREVLAEDGITVSAADVFARFLGRSFAAVEAYYREATGNIMPRHFRDRYRERLFAAFAASLRPVPDVEGVLHGLDQPFCLASSSDMERIQLTLSVTGLAEVFGERVFNAAMVKHGKPAPDLFLLAAERMGVAAAETLVVEDTEPGVRAGKAAGMTVWGFTGGSHYSGRDVGGILAAAGADRVFAAMADFSSG